jgi:hypothetical protein
MSLLVGGIWSVAGWNIEKGVAGIELFIKLYIRKSTAVFIFSLSLNRHCSGIASGGGGLNIN